MEIKREQVDRERLSVYRKGWVFEGIDLEEKRKINIRIISLS